ncbi:uncharacterized protein DSM5745_05775 [Aspergillus mulundensis]|uniref:Fe2OG dioxygenase domain-containing protein n=1 Tax=Aspergillus mulundensis TaxID=1810919 RepID=A0A3D8RXY6_9EURO|nr:hypothetical protein DSM5745_05775 [Aspergillus mulundensis]RDW78923.1 hypothetical protein DSM5745_05775 [Aspergillus mulundensis]
MAPTRYTDRPIPKISLRDFEQRIDEITSELIDASENVGFFTITDHGISTADIDSMFALSQSFFSLPDEIKATVPWNPNNVGWEKNSQVRPSTGQPDTKESYQLQFGENMDGIWLDDKHINGFREKCLDFMHAVQRVSELLMRCFARGLGFPDAFFVKAHDISRANCQTTCRLLHYFALPPPAQSAAEGKTYHRAGAHADWDFLTLLFQKEGQSGLEICPGREVVTEFGIGDEWTKVEPVGGEIVCNIGDLLMSWSDDRFKSTFHRVKAPESEGDYFGDRHSIAFFNQPCKDAVIQGPGKKYPVVTGEEFNRNAMQRNFRALQEKLRALEAN